MKTGFRNHDSSVVLVSGAAKARVGRLWNIGMAGEDLSWVARKLRSETSLWLARARRVRCSSVVVYGQVRQDHELAKVVGQVVCEVGT